MLNKCLTIKKKRNYNVINLSDALDILPRLKYVGFLDVVK